MLRQGFGGHRDGVGAAGEGLDLSEINQLQQELLVWRERLLVGRKGRALEVVEAPASRGEVGG